MAADDQPQPPARATRRGRHDADELLIAALAGGRSVIDAARDAGVSIKTARRRLTVPSFEDRVKQLRSRFVADALAKLEGSMGDAADTLRGLLNDDDKHVRIRAAVEVLRNAVRVKQEHELAERVRRLEEVLSKGGQQ